MTIIAYLVASGLLEPEIDMEQLLILMDAVAAKSEAASTATNELRQALTELKTAIDSILEGLA